MQNSRKLKQSMRRELIAIRRTMEIERFKNNMPLGAELYQLTRKDCVDFGQGNVGARMRFAQESGLFPKG